MISWLILIIATAVCLALGVFISQMIFAMLFMAFRLHVRYMSTSRQPVAVQSTSAKI